MRCMDSKLGFGKTNKLGIFDIMWLYVFGGFTGFVCETLFHLLKYHEFVNKQGMLFGPFKPLYGFGAIVMFIIYRNVKRKKHSFVFLSGIVLGSVYEYFVSFFEEKFLGFNSWLYSDGPFVINGRVYIPYCLLWGFIILFFYLIIPCLKGLYRRFINHEWFYWVSIVAFVFMLFNLILTLFAVSRYVDRCNNIDAQTFISRKVDSLYDDSFMRKRFPNIRAAKD